MNFQKRKGKYGDNLWPLPRSRSINISAYYVLRALSYETKWATRTCYEPPNLHSAVMH